MTELEPLAQASRNPHTRALLQAGRDDGPPADFSKKLLLGLSVASATTSLAMGASASAGATGVAKAGAGSALWLLAAKWVALGMLGGGILAGGVNAVLTSAPPSTPSTRQTSELPARGALEPNRRALAPPSAPALAASDNAVRELLHPSPSVERFAASPRPGAPTGQLGREVQQIDRARAAFAAGNAAQALAELDAFDRLAQTGVLEREARVLRIDTLQRLGRTQESRIAAERYVQSYPNDAHAVRLRALLNAHPER